MASTTPDVVGDVLGLLMQAEHEALTEANRFREIRERVERPAPRQKKKAKRGRPKRTTREAILVEVEKRGAVKRADLIHKMGGSPAAVDQAVARMREAGEVRSVRRGVIALP